MASVTENTKDGPRLRSTELTVIPESESPENSGSFQEREPPPVVAKDSKRAWLVCFAAFVNQVIVMGNIHVFGIYYVSYLEDFKGTKATTALIGSVAYGIGMFCAPVASSIINKYGPHVSVMLGAILCAVSLFVSSTAKSITTLFGAYTVVYGLGMCLSYTPTMCIAGDYFDKYLTVATGIMVAGSSTGTLVFSPTTQAMIDYFGWRTALQAHGGLLLLICLPLGYLMKPLNPQKPKTPTEYIKKSMARRLMTDLQLWKNKVFLVWVLAISVVMFGYYIPYVHLVSYAIETGVSPRKASVLLLLLGGFTATGRILFGKVIEWGYLNRLHMHQISMVLTGTAAMLLPLIKVYPGLVAYVIFIGLVDGCYVVLLPVLTSTLVGSGSDSVLAWGYLTMVCSITYSLGPPIAGLIYDATGTYNIAFHVAGVPMLFGAAILFFIPWAQTTADTTNLMSAAQTYTPEQVQSGDLGIELQETTLSTTTEKLGPGMPEIVLSVDNSFVTIDLDEGESYTVPRRIKRRRRDVSMCSDLSSVSEIISEAANELVKQGLSYTRLDDDSSAGRETLSVPGSHTTSMVTSPRPISLPTQATTPQIQLIPYRDDGAASGGNTGFTLSITSPRQVYSPPAGTSPRSVADSSTTGYLGTSPPTQVRIRCPRTMAASPSSELQPVHVQVTYGTQRFRACTHAVAPNRSLHHRSTSDVIENTDVQSPRQPKVRFESTPNVDCVQEFGSFVSQMDNARKITSNPEIFAQADMRDAHVGPSGRYSNPAMHPDDTVLSFTNPFNPRFKLVSTATTSTNTESIPIPSTENTESNNVASTLVKAGDKTVDVSAFDPMNQSQDSQLAETDTHSESESSSYIFLDSKTTASEVDLQDVDLQYFDPVTTPSSEDMATPIVQSPASVPIPAIPPPPPNHRRTPRNSESIDSDATLFDDQPTSSIVHPVSSPMPSSAVFSASTSGQPRPALDTPSGDASSSARPASPTTPDADGIFVMSDLSGEENNQSES